jgi:single-strand DNA-binding protein
VYETVVTVIGNVVDHPRMRRTEKGTEVAGFRIGSTARWFDREINQWVDGAKLFVSVTCWRQLGVNVVDSVRRGDPVVVSGRLSTREYEKDGQKRSAFELEATTVGHDLSRGSAIFHRLRQDTMATFEVQEEEEPGPPALRVVPDLDVPAYEPALAAAT